MPNVATRQPSPATTPAPFMYSQLHIAGCIGALLSLNLIHWSILNWSWFWLLLIGYVSGCVIYQKSGISTSPTEDHMIYDVGRTDPSQSFKLSIEAQLRRTRDHLPVEARSVIVGIQQKVFLIEQKIQAQPELISEHATLSHIVFDYLPTTLDSYLKLPAQYAATKQLISGETPNQLLAQQLKLLEQQLSQLLDNMLSHDLESLVINGQFLQQKTAPVDFFTLADAPDTTEQPK